MEVLRRKDAQGADQPGNLPAIDTPPVSKQKPENSFLTLHPRRLRKAYRRAMLATGISIGAITIPSMVATGSPTEFVNIAYHSIAGKECPTLPKQIFSRARSVVEEASSFLIDTPPLEPVSLKLPELTTQAEDNDFFEPRLQIAEANGLNLVDFRPYKAELVDARTIDEAMIAFQNYLDNYGIATSIANEFDGKKIDSQKRINDLKTYKMGIDNLMRTYSGIPKEIINLAAPTEINLADVVANEALGEAYYKSGIANFNLKNLAYRNDSNQITAHELGHRLHVAICGGDDKIHRDPGFTRFNPKKFRYRKNHPNSPLVQQTVTDPYGATNNEEDVANIFGVILTGGLSSKISDVLKNKFAYEAGQLENEIPGSLTYLKDLGKLTASQ